MASREEKFTATIEVNSQQAQSRLNELKKEIDELRVKQKKALDENTAEGKKRAQQLQKEIDLKNKIYRQEEKHVKGLNAAMQNLSEKTYKDLQQEVRALNKLMRDGTVKKNSEEWQALAERVKQCKHEMKEYEQAVTEMPKKFSLWERATNFLNKNWGAITQIIGAVTGLSVTMRRAVQDYAEMEEEMAGVRKYTGLTAEQVRELNEELKKMDTRTSREELNQLAGAAGRLGITSQESILEFVDAADKIKVALGDDLGQGAVDQIGKLAMAFGEDEKMGLRGAMLATGSAINELAQNSSANAGFLVDFTARVAGFGKQMGLTQAQIMGFGAVMDENLLRDEMASTAFGNMLTKMQTDTEKFAKIAGKSVKEFTELIKNDANQAILTLADSLRSQDAQTMMKMLDDMGLDGARAVGVLSTMADKIDDVRERQRLATEAYREGTSVIGEFDVMNETVEARLEKCKKKFHEMTVELGEQLLPMIKYTCTGFSLMVRAMSVLAGYVTRNFTLIATLAGGIAYYTTVVKLATNATKIWAAVTTATPWGLAIAGLAGLVAIVDHFKTSMDKARQSAEELRNTEKEAIEQYGEQSRKIKILERNMRDERLSINQRREALEALKKIIPDYNGMLDEEGRLTRDNKKAIDEYLVSLQKQIQLKAYKDKLEELYKRQSEQEDARRTASDKYWNARQANTLQGSRKSGAGKLMDFLGIGEEAGLGRVLDKANEDLADTNRKIDALQKRMADVGELADKSAKDAANDGSSTTKGNSGATTYKTEAEQRKEEAERKKREEEEKKRLKERTDAVKAQYQAELACEMEAYMKGATSYEDYMESRHRLAQKYYDAMKKVYGEDSDMYKKLLDDRAKEEQDYNQERAKWTEQSLTMEHLDKEQSIRRQYMQNRVQDEDALNEALFENDIAYMRKKQKLYESDPKKWAEMEMEIQQKQKEEQFQKEQRYMERLARYREEAGLTDYQRLQEIELEGVKSFYGALVKAGQMTQEEYDDIVEHIKRKYAELQGQQIANNDIQAKASKALDTAKKNAGSKSVEAGNDAATGIFSISQAIENQKLINEQLKLLYGADYENNREYQEAKRQLDAETMQQVVAGAQAAYSTISTLMSAASSYAQACSDVEVARITANYDKQIEAAGSNSKKREKLEKEKDKAIAKAKTQANKKAMAMEYAQAVASTALAAINAYASAAKLPPPAGQTLPPIMAGIALAAGAIQLATIKKQHEAEAAGYYEGGFTGGKRYRKEAGVVHEGEFVANHQAVNNRQLMPVFSLIDQAQRSNRVGSLTAADVSRSLGAGGGSPAPIITPIVNVQTDNADLREAVDAHREATELLLQRLQQPIRAQVVLTGPDGLNEQQKRLDNLMNSK